jgi:hypothetical protein
MRKNVLKYFKDWGITSYNDNTGLGIQAKYLIQILGLKGKIVFPSKRLSENPKDNNLSFCMDFDCNYKYVENILKYFSGIIILERNKWHPNIIEIAKRLGNKIILIPNWEWFNPNDELYKLCSAIACPNNFTYNLIKNLGYPNCFQILPPIRINNIKSRQIIGKPSLFIHNAGIVDSDDRKGTLLVLQAFKNVLKKDINLIVRAQKSFDIPFHLKDSRIKLIIKNYKNNFELYKIGEVAIQPSRMEGIGYSILEPTILGIPVITTDYPPMSYYGTHNFMVKTIESKRFPYPTTKGISHAHLVEPLLNDLINAIENCAETDITNNSFFNLQWYKSTYTEEFEYGPWLEIINHIENE